MNNEYTIDTLDTTTSLTLEFDRDSWDSGNGAIAESVLDSLELTLLDPARTGCECHESRLGLYQRLSDDSFWLAEYSAAPDSITLRRVSAREYLTELGGNAAVESACLAVLTD